MARRRPVGFIALSISCTQVHQNDVQCWSRVRPHNWPPKQLMQAQWHPLPKTLGNPRATARMGHKQPAFHVWCKTQQCGAKLTSTWTTMTVSSPFAVAVLAWRKSRPPRLIGWRKGLYGKGVSPHLLDVMLPIFANHVFPF